MAEFKRASLRKIFEDAGIEIPPKDVLGQICDLHTAGLDDMNDTIKDLNDRLTAAERERDAAKASNDEDLQKKYDELRTEYDNYKSEVENKETYATKEKAYRELLKEAGIKDKFIDTVVRAERSVVEGLELQDGKISKAEELSSAAKTNWSDFVATTETITAGVEKPPANNGGTAVTKESILAIKDTVERQAAIAKNIELFKGDKS